MLPVVRIVVYVVQPSRSVFVGHKRIISVIAVIKSGIMGEFVFCPLAIVMDRKLSFIDANFSASFTNKINMLFQRFSISQFCGCISHIHASTSIATPSSAHCRGPKLRRLSLGNQSGCAFNSS